MKAFGWQVYLICETYESLNQKIEFVSQKIGSDWARRVILISDPSLLRGDLYISSTTDYLAKKGSDSSCWRGVLLSSLSPSSSSPSSSDQNLKISHLASYRLSNWKNWKELTKFQPNKKSNHAGGLHCLSDHPIDAKDNKGTEMNIESADAGIPWFLHGSDDSRDVDKLFLFPSLPDNKECKLFTSGTEEDRNIFVVKEGCVSACYKGIPDEVNNELFTNYSLHKQVYPLPVLQKVTRTVVVRVVVALKSLLIRVRRVTSVRESVVTALQSRDFREYVRVLKMLNYTKLTGDLETDDWKYICFHILQTSALVCGKEIYTKKNLVKLDPASKQFLYREKERYTESDLKILQNLKDNLLKSVEGVVINKKGDLNLFSIDRSKVENYFHQQCNGSVVDITNERILFLSWHSGIHLEPCDWPQEELPPVDNWIGAYNYNGKIMFSTFIQFDSAAIKKITTQFNRPTKTPIHSKISSILLKEESSSSSSSWTIIFNESELIKINLFNFHVISENTTCCD